MRHLYLQGRRPRPTPGLLKEAPLALKARRISHRPIEEVGQKNQDELLVATNKAMSFFQENRKPLVFGGAATLLVILGTILVTTLLAQRTASRSTLFSQALRTSVTAVEPGEAISAEPAEDGDEADQASPPAAAGAKFASYAERNTATKTSYDTFLKEYGTSGDLSVMARLARANVELAEGKAAEAVRLFQEIHAQGDVQSPQLRFFLLDGLAAAQTAAGDLEGAGKTYQEIAGLAGGGLADYAALRQGQLAEAKGSKDQARETYRAALEKHPTGPYRDELQKRLDLL